MYQLFKCASLCLPPLVRIPEPFVIPIFELGTDEDVFRSCVGSVHLSFTTVPNLSSLYQDPRSISGVFRLLGRWKDLIQDRKFTVWKFLEGAVLDERLYKLRLKLLTRWSLSRLPVYVSLTMVMLPVVVTLARATVHHLRVQSWGRRQFHCRAVPMLGLKLKSQRIREGRTKRTNLLSCELSS